MHIIYSGIRKKQTKKNIFVFCISFMYNVHCTVFTKYVDYTNNANTQCLVIFNPLNLNQISLPK